MLDRSLVRLGPVCGLCVLHPPLYILFLLGKQSLNSRKSSPSRPEIRTAIKLSVQWGAKYLLAIGAHYGSFFFCWFPRTFLLIHKLYPIFEELEDGGQHVFSYLILNAMLGY